MNRRTLIRSLLTWVCCKGSRMWGQAPKFPGKHESTLRELAATVLPESLGRPGTDAVADQFVRWVQDYRAGAEMQTGYGFTRVRYKPASPAARYLEQLDQLAWGALAESGLAGRRMKVAEALQAANVTELSFFPEGVHVAADLMTFYFRSSEANDCAYGALIGKDKCRTLTSSGSIPPVLKKDSVSAKV